jgi:hypothetical protein
MPTRGQGKRLSESQRLEIIRKLQKTNGPSKRSLAREYQVSESAIRKVWGNRETIENRSSMMSSKGLESRFRNSGGRFDELENVL